MGVNNFFSKWLIDLAYDQLPDGRVLNVSPQHIRSLKAGLQDGQMQQQLFRGKCIWHMQTKTCWNANIQA
jgi:hypothetical protein